MNKIIAVIAVAALILSGYAVYQTHPKAGGQLFDLNNVQFSNGFSAGKNKEFAVTNGGNLTITGTSATSTLSLLSTSSTKGGCIQFNATSSATKLNLTFAASTTAATTIGVAPIIRYGACP